MSMETEFGVKRITTQEASIKTATVEVKALTISGKQVTLSVFRQLQDEDLIDLKSGHLKGVPWGRVNYYWGACQPKGPDGHIHVVWQKGSELRRACVFKTSIPLWERRSRIPDPVWDAIQVVRSRWIRRILNGEIRECKQLQELQSDSVPFFGNEYWMTDLRLLEEHLRNLERDAWAKRDNSAATDESRQKLQWCLQQNDYSASEEETIFQRLRDIETAWKESYIAIASTDQLFIAT